MSRPCLAAPVMVANGVFGDAGDLHADGLRGDEPPAPSSFLGGMQLAVLHPLGKERQ